MKKVTLVFIALAIISIGHAQLPTPYNVTEANYVFMGFAGHNSSTSQQRLYYVPNLSGSPVFNISDFKPISGTNDRINGVGLNNNDGFLYGMGPFIFSNRLEVNFYKIDAAGKAQNMGIISPYVTPGVCFVNFAAGTIDKNDNYYFLTFVIKNSIFPPYSVNNLEMRMGIIPNVSNLPATPDVRISTINYHKITIGDQELLDAFQAFLNQIQNPANGIDGGIQDFDMYEGSSRMFTYVTYPDVNNSNKILGRLAVIDTTTWTANVVSNTVNEDPGVEMSGMMFDRSGKFHILFSNGKYGTIDTTTGVLSNLIDAGLPLQYGNLRGDLAAGWPGSVLPINLISFSGVAGNKKNNIKWTSAQEQNFKEFALERSNDGKVFTTIATIPAKGPNSNYSYADEISNPVYYYRLKMIDIDNEYKYSAIIKVSAESSKKATAEIFPTVTQDQVSIRSNVASIIVRVSDASGKPVITHQFNNGTNTNQLSLSTLNAGIYFITIINKADNSLIHTQKIVKQ